MPKALSAKPKTRPAEPPRPVISKYFAHLTTATSHLTANEPSRAELAQRKPGLRKSEEPPLSSLPRAKRGRAAKPIMTTSPYWANSTITTADHGEPAPLRRRSVSQSY